MHANRSPMVSVVARPRSTSPAGGTYTRYISHDRIRLNIPSERARQRSQKCARIYRAELREPVRDARNEGAGAAKDLR
ncbi:hypothetical protein [Psittacid alphaherpesvirus 5]|uniref:Uncharacterized protein n=1 Tax=Psittacid alphaherpesvirus 5 TaxID=2972693 RepID=A0A5P9JSV2_9ALPH|nr:hypothetical protein QKU09_gp66 [Psittacid alphaherpesvirus 5]QFU14610.1 hypothetical protein [Psittacid alphaherpesvirus 5]UOO01081.1 hypothetical protein [Psittacid alphaherpesvirus 5]